MAALTLDERAQAFARAILRDYRLDAEEREQELEGLAEVIARAATIYLENLEHRRK